MPKFLKQNLQKPNKKNTGKGAETPELEKLRKRIVWQAGLAVVVIVLTIVIVFAMTAAWNSNIVQTSGLQFQAEAWGFDGKITVDEGPIKAGPGDEGAVTLTVENSNQDIAAVSMNVSKANMTTAKGIQMQKRLYLYVDAQQTRNGEVMERVYLNSQDSYTYTLLGGQTLTLSETIHNDAPLKWQWVYDVVGYYVLGMKTADGKYFHEYEYLRPIEYEYDEATTVFKIEDGIPTELVSIDGQSVADFLKELSAHDGYAGTIDTSKKLEAGYYPVDVDASGYGVYAYLCDYGEIEYATDFDTDLGEAAAKGTATELYTLDLTVSAENNQNNVAEVASLGSLKSAIKDGTADVIQLTSDIIINDGSLEIPAGQQVMLDLNGYQITNQTSNSAIDVAQGASVTVFNGSMIGNGGEAFHAVGAEVLLSNVDITGFYDGVFVADNESTLGLDSKVHLVGCKLDITESAVYAGGNGSASASKTQIVIEGCTINSNGVAIMGNGNASNNSKWGTDIQIIGSTIVSNSEKVGVGVYHPQKNSTLTIYNSTISAYTGVIIKGGSVRIVKSTITGQGAKQSASFNNSGSADTGDGIYIETNYGYEIQLEISEGSIIQSTYGQSLQVYKSDASNVAVKIYNGVFDEAQPEDYIDKDSVQNGTTVTEKG